MADSQDQNAIKVEAFSPRYAAAFKALLEVEGTRFTDDKLDRGGATKLGISLRFLAAEGAFDEDGNGKADFDLDMDGDIDGRDVRLLTRGDAQYLYLKCFWERLGADQLARPIGEMLFDQAVNGGLVTARKLLQRAINSCIVQTRPLPSLGMLRVDGHLGEASRSALLWVLRQPRLGMPSLVEAYRSVAKDRYCQIASRYPSQQRFLAGWIARADRLGR